MRFAPRLAVALSCLGLLGCEPGGGGETRPPGGGPLFSEATSSSGLVGPPGPWPDGQYRIPEISAGGVALFDQDGDGDLDVYLVCHPPPAAPGAPSPNRLFRQEPGGRFVEVEGAGGLADPGYGNGVALGDTDQDGDPDVFLANLGPDALYQNGGGGLFTEVTAHSGIRESEWSSSAAFLDFDRDGDLDLYVSRYLKDDPTRVCSPALGEGRDYCGPSRYQGVPDLLFRNHGDGTFTDVTGSAGISDLRPGFGVIGADLTGDGWADIFVANDMQPNLLYVNRHDGTFIDRALELGAALNGAGRPQAGMGVAAGDLNADGHLDLLVTNLVNQTNTLYLSTVGPEGVSFLDRSASSGLGAPSLAFTSWGCGFADFDLDGDLDLAVVNGRIARAPVLPGAEVGPFWNPYAEPNQFFLNEGQGRFREAREAGGGFTARVEVTRALALGDLEGDGDVDLVSVDLGNRLRLYRTEGPAAGRHWLSVRARTGKRDALGALVTVEAGGVKQVRPILSGYSFQSAHEPVAHFGLGAAARVDLLEVRWPDGKRERFTPPGVDRAVTLSQGEGGR